ncbi:LacI family DNA-binding transcriptional regulator [Gorillibacterium timonense]|uniref:LacI family DNA-binding transcriptional regulator n=1 Tax=Gorillibacterium timonense TaxID=1689269 RepID=UPI00071CECB0|nr:LacI family DNA-binding transcriptional regulator [Gorillibacterium timonense]
MKKWTIDDVAKKAGVSKSTVSQYLNQRYEYMSEATRKRIAEVVDELDYKPNGIARSLKQNRTHTIGILVADIRYTLSIECIRAIERELQRRGNQVMICNADENPDNESRYIETLLARKVDGLIVFPTGHRHGTYKRLLEWKIPFVFLDRLVEGVSAHSLLLDNELAAKIAVDELVGMGHSRIGMLSLPQGSQAITPRKERLSGFKRAMEEAGLPVREAYLGSAPKEEIGAELERMFSLPEPPTAMLASNDLVLAEILKAANRLKLAIPEELSLIGIDEADFAAIYNPTITTIRQPANEMGTQAVKTILASIEGADVGVPITYRFPPELIRGRSVKDRRMDGSLSIDRD